MPLLSRLGAVATLVVAAALTSVGVGATPASAAACADAGGITVVVEANSLGGTDVACVSASAPTLASALFPNAGHPLTYAQQQPGFVCRVDAVPADAGCQQASPASAYWGLWWSDGTDGTWTYSSLGARSLRVPPGGSVAFAWDDRSGEVRPATSAPRTRTGAGSGSGGSGSGSGGSGSGSGAGSGTGSGGSSSGGTGSSSGGGSTGQSSTGSSGSTGSGTRGTGSPSRAASPSASSSTSASPSASASSSATSSPSASDASPSAAATLAADPDAANASSDASQPASDGSGLPVWVAPLLIVAALGVGGVVVLRRRRGASS